MLYAYAIDYVHDIQFDRFNIIDTQSAHWLHSPRLRAVEIDHAKDGSPQKRDLALLVPSVQGQSRFLVVIIPTAFES